MPASRSKEPGKPPEHSVGDNVRSAAGTFADLPEIDELLARLDKRDVHYLNQARVLGVLSDHGQIHSIDLPTGWIESTERFVSGVGTRSYRIFHPPGAPAARLCFYYRGLRLTSPEGGKFTRILEEPAHKLRDQELSSVAPVLRDKSDRTEFTLREARTADLGTKRVLIVEGTYTQTEQEVLHIFVDSDGTGTAVQEIYFQAPRDLYSQYAAHAKVAINSIKWK